MLTLGLAWSQSPITLFFPLWDSSGGNQVARIVLGPDGQVSQDVVSTRHDVANAYPGPSGRYLAYTRTLPDDTRYCTILLLDLTTGEETEVASTVWQRSVTWLPDGTALAFIGRGGDLWVADIPVSNRRRVARQVDLLVPGASSAARDGITFARGTEIWSVARNGSSERLLLDMTASAVATRDR